MIATGANLKRAMWLAVELETLARQFYLALALGNPQVLPDAEIAHVVEKFKSYGPRPKGEVVVKPRKRAAGRIVKARRKSKR